MTVILKFVSDNQYSVVVNLNIVSRFICIKKIEQAIETTGVLLLVL